MSFSELINNYIEEDDKLIKRTITAADIKNNTGLKQLSKHIRGGISQLTKQNLLTLTGNLKAYQTDKYVINGREIHPDSEQIKIIQSPQTKYNIRVIAGAGTGKTTTIACRIKYLLDTCTTPDKILVLTFNVEARKHLELTIDRMMGVDIKMDIKTIDAFCYKLKMDFGYNPVDVSFNDVSFKTANGSEGDAGKNVSNVVSNFSLNELGIAGRRIIEKYASEICGQYKYVFFDEFQDVNEDQFQILNTFVKNGCLLTVIGDDSQNIYQFRGSDNYYIVNFDKIIPNTLTYMITTNYRSTPEIINLANKSITFNKGRIDKVMQPNTQTTGTVDMHIHSSEKLSLEFIKEQIEYYVQQLSIPYEEIAILSRNTHPLKSIETEFERHRLPYVALISDQYSKDFKQLIQPGKVVISTIHRTKGLEWSVVFIIGLCDNNFPSHLNNGIKNVEEERRLFYVASTRAKRYLHFVTDAKELSFSRFIGEVLDHIQIVKKTPNKIVRDKDNRKMFIGNDENKHQESFSVNDVVELMSGRRIDQLRQLKLIPTSPINKNQIFTDTPLCFSDNIKINGFESDYGIYCDYYITRQLQIDNNQEIDDIYVKRILSNFRLSDDEKFLYDKYNLKMCLIEKIHPVNVTDADFIKLKRIIDKLDFAATTLGLDVRNIEMLLLMGLQNYHYPESFMTKLRDSYNLYKNKDLPADQIKEAIYYVSLCPKFNDKRRRLVYRDIQEMYDENSVKVIPRIDDYVKLLKNEKILCKLQMNKVFKINRENVALIGELDFINITKNTIVDIKCSDGEFKIEWLLQLMIYYALFMCNPECCANYDEIEIKNVGIINLFTGKYYEIAIPEDYDWEGLLDFVEIMMADSLKGLRENEIHNDLIASNHIINTGVVDISTIVNSSDLNQHQNINNESDPETGFVTGSGSGTGSEQDSNSIDCDESVETIQLNLVSEKSGYIVLDVENNCRTQDIIQLAYIIYDDKHIEQKRINRYVKNRLVDSRTKQITGITTDVLKTKGVDYNVIMREFLSDLIKVEFVCGHHIGTDITKLKSNLEKFKMNLVIGSDPEYNLFDNLTIKDTMNMYKTLNGKGKSISLTDMYKQLLGQDIINAHDALSDVEHTAKCYVELIRLTDIKYPPNKVSPVIKSNQSIQMNQSNQSMVTKPLINSSLIRNVTNNIIDKKIFESDENKIISRKISIEHPSVRLAKQNK
jgi:DNA polymerase III epsilon subunit-like protein